MNLDLALEAISHGDVLEAFLDVWSCWTQSCETLLSHLVAHCAEFFDVVPVALRDGVCLDKLMGSEAVRAWRRDTNAYLCELWIHLCELRDFFLGPHRGGSVQ